MRLVHLIWPPCLIPQPYDQLLPKSSKIISCAFNLHVCKTHKENVYMPYFIFIDYNYLHLFKMKYYRIRCDALNVMILEAFRII